MYRPRQLPSSTSLTRSLWRLSSSSSPIPVRNEHTRIYKCLVAGGLLLLASVTFLQVHLGSAPQGFNLDSLDNNNRGIQTSWWVSGRSGDGGEGELVSDEERDSLKIIWNGTSQRKAAAMVGVESDTGDEEFETGEELIEEEEEEPDQESLEADMEAGDKEVAIGDIPKNLTESLIISHHDLAQNKVDNAQFMQQGEKLGETIGMPKESRNGNIKLDMTSWDGEINLVDRQPDQGFKIGVKHKSGEDGGGKARQGTGEQEMEKSEGLFFWEHAFGVRKKSLKNVEHLGSAQGTTRGTGILGTGSKSMEVEKHEAAMVNRGVSKVSSQQLRGFKEFVESWKERFHGDDEMLDENVHWQLEDVVEIEDALLLSEDGPAFKPLPRLPIKKARKLGKKGEGSYNSINPVNIPMLQDPDTGPDNWMTKSDKFMLNAFQVDGYGKIDPLSSRFLLRGLRMDSVLNEEKEQEIHRELDEDAGFSEKVGKLEAGTMGVRKDKAINLSTDLHQQKPLPIDYITKISHGLQAGAENQNFLHLGGFPGVHPLLPFSVFMDEFLHQESCSIRVFTAWTTPPWSFTVRHQRTLESLFYFHLNACVVVFSETIDSNFFSIFLQKGFKVAVVQPNLHELLANTPADVFANVWMWWHKIPLFYLHYTDLLRFVALYKFGGVYMDMDVIVLKPLDSLCNTVGSEILINGEVRLNGALMAFNKSSPFLRQCLEEFTATYNDTSLEWNGSELVTRVANFSIGNGGIRWMEVPDVLQIQPPFAFFPLQSSNIFRYFVTPTDKQQQAEEKELLGRIFEESFATHFWSRLTASVVPEKGSLVETILNRYCLHCTDIL